MDKMKIRQTINIFNLATLLSIASYITAQPDTIVIGFGEFESVSVLNSDPNSNPEKTLNQTGFLPNENAASRFLSQATLGYNLSDIQSVTQTGIEDWIDNQLNTPMPYTLVDKVNEYYQYVTSKLGTTEGASDYLLWEYAWWQYHMTSSDALRQRVALALSEILVISEKSQIGGTPYALAGYYDILLQNAFGNYRNILQKVTYHPSMGIYLTYAGNPKTDVASNRYPDENYAREIMQLFTIGLFELNNDGSQKLDNENNAIPTYDNTDIAEFSKIFTGLTFGDGTYFFSGPRSRTSYLLDLNMWENYHEPGIKSLLNNFVVPDRDPIDGNADISDALDNLFNHPNVGPFLSKNLIQRLVTSNPSPAYIDRVAKVFNNNGQGIRGDMGAVVKAILLDPIANSCDSGEDVTFGKLREPFIRYFQINKAFNVSTVSGNYRNVMYQIDERVGQKPLNSNSVFNFFQNDYQPLGPIEQQNLVAPEFQITDSQTLSGWINGIYDWIIDENIADEWDMYSGEPDADYEEDKSILDFTDEVVLTTNDNLHILLDRLNLLLAQGRLSDNTLNIIKETVLKFSGYTAEDRENRAKLAIYLVLSSPEYLINR